jgi:hypothetical protein
MANVITSLFVDVYASIAKLTLFRDGNCVLIASTVSEHAHMKWLLRVLADESTNSLRKAL